MRSKQRIWVPFYALFKLYFALLFLGSMLLLYPIFLLLLSRPAYHKTAFKVKRFWAHFLLLGLASPVVMKREASLPDPPYIICPNHSSYLDIIVTYVVLPHFFLFTGKSELLKWPLFNIFFKKMDIAVDRSNPKGAHEAYQRSKRALESGKCVVIFPEGTIPRNTPKLKPFKNGAFKLAVETGVPVVPVSFTCNYRILGDLFHWSGVVKPGIIRGTIHKPITTEKHKPGDFLPLRHQVFTILSEEQERHGNQQ